MIKQKAVKLQTKFKSKLNMLRFKLDSKVEDLQAQFILEYLIPYLNRYVRSYLESKGLNPDVLPTPKVKEPTIEEKFGFTSTRGKRTYFDCYNPSWLARSFKDINEHPIVKGRSTPLKVGKIVAEESPFDFLSRSVVIDNSDPLEIVDNSAATDPVSEPIVEPVVESKPEEINLNTAEGRRRYRTKVVKATKDLMEPACTKAKKSSKKSASKTKHIKTEKITKEQ
jgi:hypothetical protein